MNNFFNMENGIFSAIGKMVDILFLSIVWALLCIPIITIGPATTALYYVVVKVIRRERGYLFREFFKSFRSNFKRGAIIGVILTIAIVVLSFDIMYAWGMMINNQNMGTILLGIFIAITIMMLCFTIYVFPILSRFEMTTKQIIKAASFMSVKHFPSTIAMAVILIISLFAAYIMPILSFVLPAVTALLISTFMERIFKKYMPEAEASEETRKDEWYLE